MLELYYCHGEVLVFDVEDWISLRKTHRILGVLAGNLSINIETLPSRLLPEEATLLLDKNLAKIIDCNYEYSSEIEDKHKKFQDELLKQEQIIYKRIRKRQLEAMIGDIVAAKRKRGDQRLAEDILNDELEKSCQITKENMISPTFLKPLFTSCSEKREITTDLLLQNTTELRCVIYRDLWDKGYFITSGNKFGGDFLVYLGDPLTYHAIFIVRCVEDPNQPQHSTEIVAFGRLATAVKKRAVLASCDTNNSISYITINWIDA